MVKWEKERIRNIQKSYISVINMVDCLIGNNYYMFALV